MKKSTSDSTSTATLRLELRTIECTEALFAPVVTLILPGQQPIVFNLTATPSRPQSKKAAKPKEVVQLEPYKIEDLLQTQLVINNPDACCDLFIKEQLKVTMDEASSKVKQTAFLSFDVAGLLTAIPLD